MRPVIVSRTGSPMRFGSPGRTPSGVYLESIALMEELRRGGVDAWWYGRVDGECPYPCVRVEGPTDEYATAAELEDQFAGPEAELRRLEPEVMITVCGSRATWTWPVNPAGAQPRQSDMRYSAPAIHALHALGLRRLCVVNDPKCFPHEGEMVEWPEVRPVALLANETREWSAVVQGRHYWCRSVEASTYWPCALPVAIRRRPRDLDVAAMHLYHPAMTALTGKKKRHDAFDRVLTPLLDAGRSVGVCGAKWEKYPRVSELTWPGHLDTMEEVLSFVTRGRGGFCIPQQPWHGSPKPLWYAIAGVQPLVDRTYPGEWPARIEEDAWEALERAEREGAREWVLANRRPDFSELWRALDGRSESGYERV